MKKKTYLQLLKNSWGLTLSIFTRPNYWIETWREIKYLRRGLKGVSIQLFAFILWFIIFTTSPLSLPILAGLAYFSQDKAIEKRKERMKVLIDGMRPNSKHIKESK